jgi:signal transduction histidine kinase
MALKDRLASASLPAAVGATLVLLALLATLQYRWAGELSEAERVRLAASARARAEGFSRDFDMELTRAWSGLQMPVEVLRSGDFTAYTERYESWLREAAHPALVKDVYLVRSGAEPGRLLRFAAERRTFEPAEWPASLTPVRDQLEDMARNGGRGAFRLGGSVPALVLPVFDRPGPGERLGAGGPPRFEWRMPPRGEPRAGGPREMPRPDFRPEPRPPEGVVLVALDPERVLPALAERHFGRADGLDYDLAVVRQDDRSQVVWRSREGSALPRAPEAAAGMMDLRFEALPGGPGGPGRPPFPGPPRAHTEDTGAWRLLVTHRAGPLDQIVAGARRRNVAVGSGILLLLAASVALVAVSAQRARRLGQRQVEFVAAVSHELRTPVAVICSTAENLADGVVSEPGQVRRYGAVLRDEGRRLGEMIEQVLQFAGAFSGRRALQLESVSVERLFEEAVAPFADVLDERGFTVVRQTPPGLPAVRGDAVVLQRALRNLVENALKYDGQGRWLALRAEAAAGGRQVQITVEDHGRGIDPSELRHVFEPFFRGKEPLAEQVHGFGLGLALVRRVVEDHGGRVDVTSVPGKGTTFTLHLPATAAPDVAAESDALPHPRG